MRSRALSNEEEDLKKQKNKTKGTYCPIRHHPSRPETLAGGCGGGLLTSGDGTHSPSSRQRRQRQRAGLSYGKRGWITSQPAEKSLQLWNWMNWKNCTGKKKKTLKHDKNTKLHVTFLDPRVQRSGRHTLHAYTTTKVTLALLEPCLHTQQGYLITQRHTSINAHQYKRWAL